MPRTPRQSAPILLACLVSLCHGPAAIAQPRPLKDPTPLPGTQAEPYRKEQFLPLFAELTYDKAREKAVRENRWLIVWYEGGGPFTQKFLERNHASASLRAWIAWHAVSIRDTGGVPRRIAEQRRRFFTMRGDSDPCVLFIRNDTVEAAVITNRGFQPTPLRVLFTGSVQYDAVAARDPVWLATHDRKNPPPQPPDLGPDLHTIADDAAPAVPDPAPDERVTVLDRLAEARALVKAGDLYRATGVYTWLWERSEKLDPAFRAARLSTLAVEMRELGKRREGALERFTHLRARSERRVLFDEPALVQEHLALASMTGDDAQVISYLSYFSDDLDEGSITPIGHQTIYSLLARRDPDIISPTELPASPAERLSRIARIATRARPTGADPADWDSARQFAQRYLLDEACRLYGAALIARKTDTAEQIAAILLKHADTPLARRSLVTTALAIDPPRALPIHSRWLAEAKSAGDVKTAELEVRLDALLRAP